MRRRLGVSDTPVGLNGPVTANICTCDCVVIPACEPICVSAMLCPIGAMLSFTGPSKVRMNAAVMRCGPARTEIGLVRISMPFGSACDMPRSTSSTAIRSPFTEISIFSSNGAAEPNSWPVGIACNVIVNTYSPSAGNVCVTDVPPRVPAGAPSTGSTCDAKRAIL